MQSDLAIVLGLIGGVFAALVLCGPRAAFAPLIALVLLLLFGVLEVAELGRLFVGGAVFTIAMMFVLSAALERAGCLAALGAVIARLAGRSGAAALALLMGAALLASAMMNNTPVVIVMTPLAIALGRAMGLAPSRLLIPLSYAAIFGGMTTLIGASTNILVSGLAQERGLEPIGMFEMTAPALIMAAAGFAYMMLIGRFLLPDRSPRPRGPALASHVALRARLALEATAAAATRVLASSSRHALASGAPAGEGVADHAPPERAGVLESAMRLGARAPEALTEAQPRDASPGKAALAIAVIALVMGLAALGVAPIAWLAGLGALIVVLGGGLTLGQAARAIDWSVIGLIIGMIGLSIAFEKAGGAALAVEALTTWGDGLSPAAMLLLLFLATSALTELVSNSAAALLATPVALALAAHLGVDPKPFLFAVMVAASASFATPVGYQTNTLVYRAGGYRFIDFLRIGLPLNLLFAGMSALLLPIFFPF
ncbi:MAG: SLC13 family permease [Pseudomonadota bacterium]